MLFLFLLVAQHTPRQTTAMSCVYLFRVQRYLVQNGDFLNHMDIKLSYYRSDGLKQIRDILFFPYSFVRMDEKSQVLYVIKP